MGLFQQQPVAMRHKNKQGAPRAPFVKLREVDYMTPKTRGAALENTGPAIRVFEELVDKISHYIKTLRRASIQEKYRSFINVLYMQERVYAAKLTVAQLLTQTGFKAAGPAGEAEAQSATQMAKARQTLGQTLGQVMPRDVSIVQSVTEWDHIPGGGSDPIAQGAENLSSAYRDVKVGIMNKAYSTQAKTQAQEIQGALGYGGNLGGPTVDGGVTYIYFTNLGDIIDVAIAIATYPSQGLFERRLGLLFGPTLEEDKSATIPNAAKYLLNLAHIPVSLKAFYCILYK